MHSLEYIENELNARGIMPKTTPSLEPFRKALRACAFEQNAFFQRLRSEPERCLVIAGTNGKGSTAATLEALLESAGESTGLYTSPHLKKITERIRYRGQDIEAEAFIESYERLNRLSEVQALSHFEMLTLLAVDLLTSGHHTAPVDRLLLEVGMGGTWDATNAVPHGFCILTSLGFDHQKFLGNTLEEIARNKFGIVSEGATVVHAPFPQTLHTLQQERQHQTHSQWHAAPAFPYKLEATLPPTSTLETPWGPAALNLLGARAAQNTTLALRSFELLGFSPGDHLRALQKVRWPGRMSLHRGVYFSGDHNQEGLESLIDILEHMPYAQLRLVVGIGQDKNPRAFLKRLAEIPRSLLYLTHTPYKGATREDYGEWVERAFHYEEDPSRCLQQAVHDKNSEDLIVVTGSLYLVGDLLKFWEAR